MHSLDTIFRCFNLPDRHSKDSFGFSVFRWAHIVLTAIKKTTPSEFVAKFPEVLLEGWQRTHIRCQLVEKLAHRVDLMGAEKHKEELVKQVKLTAAAIAFATGRHFERTEAVARFKQLEKTFPTALNYMTLVWCAADFSADPDDRYAWRDFTVRTAVPTVMFYPEDHRESVKSEISGSSAKSEEVRKSLLTGQRAAFDDLRGMLRARRQGLSAGGIRPRLHALVLGPSGAGKTHAIRSFARAEKLPIFEQSAASWLPLGGRSDTPTAKKIAQFVGGNDEGVIFLDEVEKPFPQNFLTASAWERANADELMSLLDARVGSWDGWNVALAEKLASQYFIVVAGAWQHIYQAALPAHELLGGEWSNLSILDGFLEENHLPAELLNRVSAKLIEVLAPSREELICMVKNVQRDLGIPEDDTEAQCVASEIAMERKGVRGVEAFILQKWLELPSSSGNPTWF